MTPSSPSVTGAEAAMRWRARRTATGTSTGTGTGPIDLHHAWGRYLEAAGRELEATGTGTDRRFPHVTEQGRWRRLPIDTRSDASGEHYEHGNWTAGFTLGIAWLHATVTGERASAELATSWVATLAERADDHTTHDLGFLFFPGVALGRVLGLLDQRHDTLAHTAARTLAARYNPATGLLQAFGPTGAPALAGTSTIDTMMNLPLLWWAHRCGADPLLFDIARRHARTSARLYLRPDGSTYHLLRLDPTSGALLHRGTFQGETPDSCWSRGQAWAVCGMAWAYAATGESELLEAAERAAGYFFDHLPGDGVPPWDFTTTQHADIRDASAAAATALGCLLLADNHPSPADAAHYRDAATALLADLTTSCLNTDPHRDGLLLRSTYSLPHRAGIEEATAFGDFYFGLALACATHALTPAELTRRM